MPRSYAWWIIGGRGHVKRRMGLIDDGLVTIEPCHTDDAEDPDPEVLRVTKQIASLPVLLSALDEIDQTLRIPAAEYVPAIGDVFAIIDRVKATIENPQR